MSDHVNVLADFVAGIQYADLPASTREHAKLVFMDTLGVILGSSNAEEVTRLSSSLLQKHHREEATVLREGFPLTDASSAALLNGTAAPFHILDENHPTSGHHAVHIVPAMLALGEALHASGEAVLTAFVTGYEVAARIGSACRRGDGIHPHGHFSLVGAAVACATLRNFNRDEIRETINVASILPLATSLKARVDGATATNAWAGVSAQIGMLVPELVGSGFTGPAGAVGETFGHLVGRDYSADRLIAELGTPHKIAESGLRLYACCGEAHAAIDATRDLIAEREVQPDDIASIDVYSYEGAAHLTAQHPDNPQSARFSIPYVVAATIVRGSCSVDAFQPTVIRDPALQRVAGRVNVYENPSLTERWPADVSARVEVTLTDGETLSSFCRHARGTLGNPLSAAELEEKFRFLAGNVVSKAALDETVAALQHLDAVDDVGDVTALMSGESRRHP